MSKTANKLRIIFMGTPDFAIPSLNALIKNTDLEIVGVFTQTDKSAGRGKLMTAPPIKQLAIQNNLSVFQPLKIKTETDNIRKLKPDLIVVVAYGKIIPQEILDIPTYGCLNVHASLLPKYRGAACLNAPILYGDSETGITIMKMEAGLDTGPILRQEKISLQGEENLEYVHDKLANLGAQILPEVIKDWINGNIKPIEQEESKASYIKMLSKEDGHINWNRPAEEIERMIRAYNPWPGTFSFLNKEILKIVEVDKNPLKINNYRAGEIFINQGQLAIQCQPDALIVRKLQVSGKKIVDSADFLRGHKLEGILE